MSIPLAIQPLTAAAGYSNATGERIIRPLRAAGMVPPGERFGAPDWEPPHLVNYLLACTSLTPIDGPQVVETFARCRFVTSPLAGDDQRPRLGPGTVRDVLVRLVEGTARLLAEHGPQRAIERSALPLDPDTTAPHYLNFRLNAPVAEFVWYSPDGRQERIDVYTPSRADEDALLRAPPLWRTSVITRSTIMPFPLIQTAAEAWLATLRRHGADPAAAPPSSPDRRSQDDYR